MQEEEVEEEEGEEKGSLVPRNKLLGNLVWSANNLIVPRHFVQQGGITWCFRGGEQRPSSPCSLLPYSLPFLPSRLPYFHFFATLPSFL